MARWCGGVGRFRDEIGRQKPLGEVERIARPNQILNRMRLPQVKTCGFLPSITCSRWTAIRERRTKTCMRIRVEAAAPTYSWRTSEGGTSAASQTVFSSMTARLACAAVD